MSAPTLQRRLAALSVGARALLARRLQPHTNQRQAVGTGSEQLVVFYELREGTPVTTSELRRLLLERLPRFMVPSRFVALNALPLLPNGKVDRRALAEKPDDAMPASVRAATPPVAERAADDEVTRLLAVWRDVLGPSVGAQDDFFEAGGDSLVAMRLISRAAKAGFKVTPTEFFRTPTVVGMVAAARSHAGRSAAPRRADNRWRPVPLTPIQHWFFEQQFAGADRWNQARLFEIAPDLDHQRLEAALTALVEHHEAFRLACVRKAGGWQQHVQPLASPIAIPRVEVLAGDQQAREAAIEREAIALQAAMRLDSGLLLRALRLRVPGDAQDRDLLYLVGHHLCLDVVSWDILLEDLETVCEQLESGQPVSLPSATSFSEWASALYAYAQSPGLHRERSWWSTVTRAVAPPLPRDFGEGGPNDEASAEVVYSHLESEETGRLLLDYARPAGGGSLTEHILTALVRSLAAWSGHSTFRVGIEGHGRTDLTPGIDVSRTVGWFTTYWPVVFELTKDESLPEVLRIVREHVGAVPGQGQGYGVLRYLTADDGLTRELAAMPAPEVSFNYIGRQQPSRAGDLRFRPLDGLFGVSRDARARRPSLLEISARVLDDRLELACGYSRNIHRRETIQELMRRVGETLVALAATTSAARGRIASASEFPDAGLSQEELNSLIDPA